MQELLDSRRVHYFLQVVASGSVRAAAEQLGVEASAVSRAVSLLEKECGMALLERRGRGVVPTDAGRLLATYARRQLDVQATFYAEVESLRSASRGHIDLVLGEGMLDLFFQPLVSDFMRAHAHVTVNLNVQSTADSIDLILQDKAHVGVVFQPPSDVRLRSHHATPSAPIQAIVHRSHPLTQIGRPLQLSDLLGYPGAAMQDSFGVRQHVNAAEISEQLQLNNVLVTSSFKVLWHFADAGLGYALTTASAAFASRIQMPDVVALPMANPILNRGAMHVLTRTGRHLPPAVLSLLEHFIKGIPAQR
ncbi:LysR family transcriptional regulator [Variovorax sp. J22R133]|uniref:LysR family transcriptional regulator n=1 Tax=Variovorax brevis TaxID=3053503 RepID=UPI00257633E0|nr:LysR family transcriptional regulator [Variovorax sp. J22R133]MDM0117390.1 LysR family transcriptional regulator [Variovorax sp. J22R133]